MSLTKHFILPSGESLLNDTNLANVPDGVKSSPATLNSFVLDNSANGPTGSNSGGTAAYLKFYNTQSGNVIVGTTEPDEVIYGPGGSEISVEYWLGAEVGKAFPVALSMSCEVSGATGATGPTNPVVATVSYR
jgi:hypothetical protein